jgi:uncharacterized protein with NRDE domain
MCTLAILRRPRHHWPFLLAANRDEMITRAWEAPARHWPDRPTIVGGLDHEAGGSWLGINDYGVVAGVSNRTSALGPAKNKRTRGELVLEALEHADAKIAAEALSRIDGRSYRPFNMLIADNRDAYWLAHRDDQNFSLVAVHAIPSGISMLTSHDLNDETSPRIRTFLPRFSKSSEPDPDANEWSEWKELLACRFHAKNDDPTEAMNIVTDFGFGTSSRSLIALPALAKKNKLPIWNFASGYPSCGDYWPISLEPESASKQSTV